MEDEAEAERRLGSRLGSYILHGIIGRGGMGVVYSAEHVYIGKPFAVKVLNRQYFDQAEARERFLQEARTAGRIDHPHIVGVTDFGEAADGTVFLVMAQVQGMALDAVLRREGTLPLFRSLVILTQVTHALAAAHAKDVIHRDMKPENIMLASRHGHRELVRAIPDDDGNTIESIEPEGNYDFATILDFGAAKFFDPKVTTGGDTSVVIGTPAYMAPETARDGVADPRSDIYAVGVIFYEMLTGVVPFDADTAIELMMKHVSEPVPRPSEMNPTVEITPEAEAVILRALEKDPAARYATMEEFYWALHACYGKIRFRRTEHVMPPGMRVEALRGVVPLTKKKLSQPIPKATQDILRNAAPPPTMVVQPEDDKTPGGPVPIMLTKKKLRRAATLPFISIERDKIQLAAAPRKSNPQGPLSDDDEPTKPRN